MAFFSLPKDIPAGRYLAAALILRLVLAPFLSHPFDMRIFMAVGAAVARGVTPYGQYTLDELFVSTPHPHLHGTLPGIGYPPPWGLLSGLIYSVSSATASNNLYAYVLALKVPIILAELVLAVMIYNLLRLHIGPHVASKGFILFLFCPFIISVGTVWGMFDVLALVFALTSAYYLRDSWKISALCLSVSSALKLFPIILVPLYALLLHRESHVTRRTVSFLVLTVGLVLCFTFIPMLVFGWPITNLYNALAYHIGPTSSAYDNTVEFPYGAASAFNVFSLVNYFTHEGVQLPWIFCYFWIGACAGTYVLFWRSQVHKFDFALTVKWSLIVLLVFFTTRPWVSEQNLLFLFTFFALSYLFTRAFQVELKLEDLGNVRLMWALLFSFVIVHVPAIAFFWLPIPESLGIATSFCDGPLGWTRLLSMTLLAIGWLALSWDHVIKTLRGVPESLDAAPKVAFDPAPEQTENQEITQSSATENQPPPRKRTRRVSTVRRKSKSKKSGGSDTE